MLKHKDIPAPSDDKRWKLVDATMRRNGYRPDVLIETLHSVQEAFGFLDDAALQYVAHKLHVAPSQVYGVATFYHYFSLKPQGEHVCSVCTGTACHIKGAEKIIRDLYAQYGILPGETTEDNALSLLTVRCVGACGLAPAVVLDGNVLGNMTPEQMRRAIELVLRDTAREETPEREDVHA